MTPFNLPIISLTDTHENIILQLQQACNDTGFFYITDHGISEGLLHDVFQQARLFFDSDMSTKQSASFNRWYRGYSPMYNPKTGDMSKDRKEGFYVGRHYVPEDPLYDSSPFHGSNSMPNISDLPNFQSTVMRYHNSVESLALRVSSFIFNTLGLYGPEDLTKQPGNFDEPLNALRLIHYPAVPVDAKPYILSDGTVDSVYGNGSHTDSGMVTILANDNVSGLQIYTNGKWYDVPQQSNCLLVNLADMLAIWTNNKYKSTKHRVIRPPGL